MHILTTPRTLQIAIPGAVALVFAVLLLSGVLTGPRPDLQSHRATLPVPQTLETPRPSAPTRQSSRSALAPAAPAQEVVEPPVEYRLNEQGASADVRRLLTELMDDPWIRMDPDQRSQFLGAVLRAQREYDAEMNRAFDLDDELTVRGASSAERSDAVTRIQRATSARLGERLAEELAMFLTPEQMRQLRGRISFRDFMLAFLRTDAITEVR
jgi:hypothetical protein